MLKKIQIQTSKQFEIVDITKEVLNVITESTVQQGIALIYSPHTTASIRINHYEPLLLQDILRAEYRLVPQDISYNHDLFELRANAAANERSNGHAHVKAFLLGSSESVIIDSGRAVLGDRQSIWFVEFDGGRKRDCYVKIVGG